ncbi:MAG: polysaccharide biosynthesis/export family protein [Bacteroidaceae bacterium]|nr:polysaccharide biosynthesis/export family protein [Bacteroidaceae bacterium]
MKKYSTLALLAIAILCLSSCVSSKKIIYFQGSDSLYAQAQDIVQKYEMRLKPADQVLIKVTCDNPELLEIFNLDVTMGSGMRGGGNLSYGTTGSMGSVYGYTVDNEGYLDLPSLGKVKVGNMTVDEAARAVEKVIQSRNLIKEPEVTVRLLNARVAVLGAVKSPHVVSLNSERNTILDVLASCGDVSDQALRQNVTLFRENNGKREMFHMDLTQADIFKSPGFYVQQNDLIYIQPNKSQNVKSSAFSTFLGVGGSVISALASMTALVISIVNLSK